MSWIRSSRGVALGVLLALSLVAVGTAAAATYSADAPDSVEVGETVEVTVTIEDPFTGDMGDQWTLAGQTQLENASWSIQQIRQGETVQTDPASGSSFTQPLDIDDGADEVRVTVTGDAPALDTYDYRDMSAENFTIAAIGRQVDGTFNEDNRWSAHRYTTGTGDSVGSQEAREAIDEAIDAAGGENDNIEQAISSYNNGNFENAQSLADEAESGAQSSQLMMIAAGVVIVLALVGGGIYYWRENRDQGHKLQ